MLNASDNTAGGKYLGIDWQPIVAKVSSFIQNKNEQSID